MIETPEAPPVPFGDLYVNRIEGVDHLPEPVNPYTVLAANGLYKYRPTAIGNALLPTKDWPKVLKEITTQGGLFTFTADQIPAKICAQAYSFFRRIFEKHGTEAEVLITRNWDTGEYRLFIPTQSTSHSGVSSLYKPSHIEDGWQVVGTMHSHCDFGAFHSGTDSADAADMDGVHFTLGHVNTDTPDIAAMVVMSGVEFHYKDFERLADFSDLKADTAPGWWDNYVHPGMTVPKQKPAYWSEISDAQWAKFAGEYQWHGRRSGSTATRGGSINAWDNWDDADYFGGYRYDPDSRALIPMSEAPKNPPQKVTQLKPRGPWYEHPMGCPCEECVAHWCKDCGMYFGEATAEHLRKHGITADPKDPFTQELKDESNEYEDTYFHDLSKKAVDAMFDSDLLTDDDLDTPATSADEWETRFIRKAFGAVAVLKAMGFTVEMKLTDNRKTADKKEPIS